MKLNRRQLRKLITATLSEGLYIPKIGEDMQALVDEAPDKRAKGEAEYDGGLRIRVTKEDAEEAAVEQARKNGGAGFENARVIAMEADEVANKIHVVVEKS